MFGLYTNEHKSKIYCGELPRAIQQVIPADTSFALGSFPFRYLGLPLSTKGLSHNLCQPLIDKIKQKICT